MDFHILPKPDTGLEQKVSGMLLKNWMEAASFRWQILTLFCALFYNTWFAFFIGFCYDKNNKNISIRRWAYANRFYWCLAVISSKCIEGYLFPELARQSYRWSFSFVFFLVEIILCVSLFFSYKEIYKPAVEQKSPGMEWHYLWIIPCTFYLMWNYTIYGDANRSSLESAMRPGNSFIFFRAGTYIWDHLLRFRFDSKTYFYFRDRFIHSIWKSSGKCRRCLQCTIWWRQKNNRPR